MRWWLFEMRRAVVSGPFLLALALFAGAQAWWMGQELQWGDQSGVFYLFTRLVVGPVSLMAPVLAAIPFAQSYALERNSGFSRNVLIRTKAARYKAVRLVSNALAGGLALAVPMTVALLLLMLRYPVIEIEGVREGPQPFIGKAVLLDQTVYMWASVGVFFLFGATFATAGLAFSTLLRNPYYALVTPFAAYMIPAVIFGSIGLAYLYPGMMLIPSANMYATPASVGAQYAVFWAVSLALYLRYFRFKEE